MGQLVRQHRLLLVRLDPVQQIHSLRLVVVKPSDLLRQQRKKKGAQMKVAIEQAQTSSAQSRSAPYASRLRPRRTSPEVLVDLIARDQFALHSVLNRQLRVGAGEAEDLVHRAKELLRLLLRHRGLCRSLVCGLRRRLTGIGSCCLRPHRPHNWPPVARAPATHPINLLSPPQSARCNITLSIHRYNQVYESFP